MLGYYDLEFKIPFKSWKKEKNILLKKYFQTLFLDNVASSNTDILKDLSKIGSIALLWEILRNLYHATFHQETLAIPHIFLVTNEIQWIVIIAKSKKHCPQLIHETI